MGALEGVAQAIGMIVGLTYSEVDGGNVFVGYMPSTPDEAVAIYTQSGEEADSKLPYDPVDFTVTTRSEDGGLWARGMSDSIFSKMHGLRNVTLPDGTYLVYCLAQNASPFPLGPDENGRPRFTTEYRAEIIHPTEHRS